jgi:hypothetical protein
MNSNGHKNKTTHSTLRTQEMMQLVPRAAASTELNHGYVLLCSVAAASISSSAVPTRLTKLLTNCVAAAIHTNARAQKIVQLCNGRKRGGRKNNPSGQEHYSESAVCEVQ